MDGLLESVGPEYVEDAVRHAAHYIARSMGRSTPTASPISTASRRVTLPIPISRAVLRVPSADGVEPVVIEPDGREIPLSELGEHGRDPDQGSTDESLPFGEV